MAKYQVECGAFVEYLRQRKIVVHANSQEEAEKKAVEKFEKLFEHATDISTVRIDSCTEEANDGR